MNGFAFTIRRLIWVLVLASLCRPAGGADGFSSFRVDILPILTQAGCNAGACHGAATGQGGFALSLLGYAPETDHRRITRELGGRRLDLTRPAESLFLQKPAQQIDHEGGRRLPVDSDGYRQVLSWIEAGAPYGRGDLQVARIDVTPGDQLLPATNQTVPLRVTAVLTDGSTRDVTARALYTSNDDAIAEVNRAGQVTTRGHGLTSIMVRFGGQVAAARVAVPYDVDQGREVDFPTGHFIDRHLVAEWRRLGLSPAERSGDAEFLRRVSLDLTGRLPSVAEARRLLASPLTDAIRQDWVDALLGREEFTDFWTMKLADLLLIGGRRGGEVGARTYQLWLREQIARNAPWDQIVRSLLTASGDTRRHGPANFFTLARDPRDLAEHVGRMFLGSQIACARCHAHPTDRWTQEDYHQFSAYFARVVVEGDEVKIGTRGEVELPETGRPALPKPLGVAVKPERPDASSPHDRRLELAAWLVAPDNPMFARTFVNRVWKHLMGRGLVEPVDDLRPTNPATHPALLDALAADFVEQGHDLRKLIRGIVSSRAYQLTSRPGPGNARDDRFYARAYLKPLPAQVFVDAVSDVTGVAERFLNRSRSPSEPGDGDAIETGAAESGPLRAVQLVGSLTPSYALDVLGRCSREQTCDTPGSAGGGLAAALHLINGPTINEKLRDGIVRQLLERGASDREIIDELYLRALTRPPGPEERAAWEHGLAVAGNRREAVEDLLWALLNSREFAFNH